MPTGAKTAKILQKQLFGGELEALTGSKPISASQDILAELENALKGREKKSSIPRTASTAYLKITASCVRRRDYMILILIKK